MPKNLSPKQTLVATPLPADSQQHMTSYVVHNVYTSVLVPSMFPDIIIIMYFVQPP